MGYNRTAAWFNYRLKCRIMHKYCSMSAVYSKCFGAVFLCIHAYGPKLSYAAAAEVIKKSKEFLQMWVLRYRNTKFWMTCKKEGRRYHRTLQEKPYYFRISHLSLLQV